MVLIMKLLGIILGFIFPVFLIEAISLQKEDSAKASRYRALSSLSFGLIIFIIMGLLPN
jgi:hypothetical protein